ncbi:FAD-binding oxidoreductase, partial [Pseudomonas syringae]
PDMPNRRAYFQPEVLSNPMKQMKRRLPGAAKRDDIRVWSGIEIYTPDSLPIMGRSGKVDGLFYAFGFCGHGFQLGPGVGDVMAALISTGSTRTLIIPFDIRRFTHPTPTEMPLMSILMSTGKLVLSTPLTHPIPTASPCLQPHPLP